jgi:hypothetical protein
VSPTDFSSEHGRRSDFPQENERFLREEEQELLRDEDRQLMREDDRGISVARVEGQCAYHPQSAATAACFECRKQLCAECVFASGGGHSFCKQCMDSSRLVNAEPQILGQVVEEPDTREGLTPRLTILVLVAVLALVAIAMAAILAISTLL